MKVSQYLKGRAREYDPTQYAQTRGAQIPAPGWRVPNRASDTPGGRPTVEMMCTTYGQPAVIFSHTDNSGRPFTFCEFVFPQSLSCTDAEWKDYLREPGKLMYMPPVSGEEWLGFFSMGKIELLPEKEVSLAQLGKDAVHAARPGDAFLGALLADLWYCCAERIMRPTEPQTWPVLRLELTDAEHAAMTLDEGRAFVCEHILPHLPVPVRHMVSVSIGGQYEILKSAGYMTALQISLPGEVPLSCHEPGTYRFVGGAEQFNPLFAAQCRMESYADSELGLCDESCWRALGQALLTDSPDAPHPTLAYYHTLSDARQDDPISADFYFALSFAAARTYLTPAADGSYHAESVEKAHQLFAEVSDALLDSFSVGECRLLMAGYETDLARAQASLLGGASWKRYFFLCRRAFSLFDDFKPSGKAQQEQFDALRKAYTQLLIAPSSLSDVPSIPFIHLLEDEQEQSLNRLLQNKQEHIRFFNDTLEACLCLHCVHELPDRKMLLLLDRYGHETEECGAVISRYAIALIQHGHPVNKLSALRAFQQKGNMDSAVIDSFAQSLQTILTTEDGEEPYLEYLDGITGSESEVEALRTQLCHMVAAHAEEHAKLLVGRLERTLGLMQRFSRLTSEESVSCAQSILAAREGQQEVLLSAAEAELLCPVLSFASVQNGSAALQKALGAQFAAALPHLLGVANPVKPQAAAFTLWTSCIRALAGTADVLRNAMSEALCSFCRVQAQALAEKDALRQIAEFYRQIGRHQTTQALDSAVALLEQYIPCGHAPVSPSEISLLRPVLALGSQRSAVRLYDRLKSALKAQFAAALPQILDIENTGIASGVTSAAWAAALEAMPDDQASLFGVMLADSLDAFVLEQAGRLTHHLPRVLRLYADVGQTRGAGMLQSGAAILAARSGSLKTIVSDGDVPDLQQLCAAARSLRRDDLTRALIDALSAHLRTGLAHMIAMDSLVAPVSVQPFKECLASIGSARGSLSSAFAQTAKGYFCANAEQYAAQLCSVMELCRDLGMADTEEARECACSILHAAASARVVPDERDMASLAAVAGSSPELSEALCALFAVCLPQLIHQSHTLRDADALVHPWLACLKGSGTQSLRTHLLTQLQAFVCAQPASFDSLICNLYHFACAMDWQVSEEVCACIACVLESRDIHQTALLSDEETGVLCEMVAQGAGSAFTLRLRAITGRLPACADDPQKESALRGELMRQLRTLLPVLHLSAVPSAQEAPAWHQAILDILCEDLETMIGEQTHYAQLAAPGLAWKKYSTLRLFELRDQDSPDRFAAWLGSQDLFLLSERLSAAMRDAVARFELHELLQAGNSSMDGWYSRLLKATLLRRLEESSADLLADVRTRDEAAGLRALLDRFTQAGAGSSAMRDAIGFVLHHVSGADPKKELAAFSALSDRDSASLLLEKAMSGSSGWGDSWTRSLWSDTLTGAACRCLVSRSRGARAFLDILEPVLLSFDGDKKQAAASGQSPVHKLLFVYQWLYTMGFEAVPAQLSDALQENRFTSLLRELRLSAKENKAMLRPLSEAGGAAADVFHLLF